MSYHPDGPGLGIGTGIGTQAMAGLGSCCAPCASGAKRCGAAGLGDAASRAAGRETTTTTKPTASKTAPAISLAVSPSVLLVDPGQTVTAVSPATQLGGGGMSTLAKVAIAGLLVGGGVLVYRRIKNRKK